MISFQSVFALMVLANAAAVSSIALADSPITSVTFPETVFPGPSSSALVTPVNGTLESSVIYPITSSVLGTVALSSIGSAITSYISEPITGTFTTITVPATPVATSTAVFTFTYVPVETVTVTEYRCHKANTSVVHPRTTTARPITITEPTRVITSVLPSASEFGTPSIYAEPSVVSVVSSVAFSEPTTSFAS